MTGLKWIVWTVCLALAAAAGSCEKKEDSKSTPVTEKGMTKAVEKAGGESEKVMGVAKESAKDVEKTMAKMGKEVEKMTAEAEKMMVQAGAFKLKDQNGKDVSLSDYAGKTVVLEFLNPDCPFVKRHHDNKTMVTLADKYASKGVAWLGINSTSGQDIAKNKTFADQYKLPYPVLDDHLGVVGKLYGAKTTPYMIVIDPKGEIAYRGGVDDDPSGQKSGSATNYVQKALDAVVAGKMPEVQEAKSYGCSVKYAK